MLADILSQPVEHTVVTVEPLALILELVQQLLAALAVSREQGQLVSAAKSEDDNSAPHRRSDNHASGSSRTCGKRVGEEREEKRRETLAWDTKSTWPQPRAPSDDGGNAACVEPLVRIHGGPGRGGTRGVVYNGQPAPRRSAPLGGPVATRQPVNPSPQYTRDRKRDLLEPLSTRSWGPFSRQAPLTVLAIAADL